MRFSVKTLVAATVVVAVMAPSDLWAQGFRRVKQGPQCVPCCDAEFVNNLKIWNPGTTPVPSGARLYWDVGKGKWTGKIVLGKSLAPGAEMILRNVMNGAQIQSPCALRVVEPYPEYAVTLAPANLVLRFGEEKTLTATLDKPALTVGIGSQVSQSGSPGCITLNGEVSPVVMFAGGKTSATIRVKGARVGGPVTVSIKLAPSVGGATATARVTVKPPAESMRRRKP